MEADEELESLMDFNPEEEGVAYDHTELSDLTKQSLTSHYSIAWRYCQIVACYNWTEGRTNSFSSFFFSNVFQVIYMFEPVIFALGLGEVGLIYGSGWGNTLILVVTIIMFLLMVVYVLVYLCLLIHIIFRCNVFGLIHKRWKHSDNLNGCSNRFFKYSRKTGIISTEVHSGVSTEVNCMAYTSEWENKYNLTYSLWVPLLLASWTVFAAGLWIMYEDHLSKTTTTTPTTTTTTT